MGFNKRFLAADNLNQQFKDGGALAVIEYITNPDALISTDDFSSLFLDLPLTWNNGNPSDHSLNIINELFWNYKHHWTDGKRNK